MKNLQKHFKKSWKNYLIALVAILFVGNMVFGSFTFNDYGASGLEFLQTDSLSAGFNTFADRFGGFAPDEDVRKVTRNARMSLEVEDYEIVTVKIKGLVESYSAIILSENEGKFRDEHRIVSYTVKVDAERLDSFLEELKSYGEVKYINVYTGDVTGTHQDYSERIERYESQLVKYNKLIGNGTLEVKDEIEIQTRIDQIEDQLFYLNRSLGELKEIVSYSTVHVTVREKLSLVEEAGFLKLEDALKLFLASLKSGIETFLMILGFLIPFGAAYGIYRLAKMMKGRK